MCQLRVILALAMSLVIVPGAPVEGQSPPIQFGHVVSAITGKPIAGVRIVAIDSGKPGLMSPRVLETVSDSLGSYTLSLWGHSWVAYTAAEYGSVRLVYPDSLLQCDSCCGKLIDVRLVPER